MSGLLYLLTCYVITGIMHSVRSLCQGRGTLLSLRDGAMWAVDAYKAFGEAFD